MASLSFVRQNFRTLLLTALFLLGLSLNTFGQTEPNVKKLPFNSLLTNTQKTKSTEISRPRIIKQTDSAQNQRVTPNSDQPEKITNEVAGSIKNAPSAMVSGLERQAFEIINTRRKENGLPPIRWSEDMAKIARTHSENMAKFNFFSHTGKDGSMVNDRADAMGISDWRAIGENIAYNRGYEKPAEFACERWMLSTGHRENILNNRWKEAGIGVAIAEDGTYYFTQVFVIR